MQINLTPKQKMIASIIAGILILVGGGYYWYSTREPSQGSTGTFNKGFVSTEVKAYIDAKEKIMIKEKDLQFREKEIYPLLRDYSQEIPFKVPEGRPNPFVPFAP